MPATAFGSHDEGLLEVPSACCTAPVLSGWKALSNRKVISAGTYYSFNLQIK